MDWDFFVQQLVNGLTLGSVYALIALGYSMVYGILKLLNFAHGDVYMIGAFIGFGVLTVLGGAVEPERSRSGSLLVADVRRRDARLRRARRRRSSGSPTGRCANAPRIAPLITALGVSFFLENSALLLFGADFRSYDTFYLDDGALFVKGIRSGRCTSRWCGSSSIVARARADGRAHAASSTARRSARRCARPRSTARRRR